MTAIAALPEQMDKYKNDNIEIIKLYSGLSPHAAGFVVKEAHRRDIVVIADFWRMNMGPDHHGGDRSGRVGPW